MNIKIVTKAILVNTEEAVLVLRRSPFDDIKPGMGDFPGGSVEAGESVTEATVREIKEEAGITVKAEDLHLVHAISTDPANGEQALVRLVFRGKVSADTVRLSEEHDMYQWLPLNQALAALEGVVWQDGLAFAARNNLLA